MKSKFVVLLFMLIISFLAKADKIHRRDRTICEYKGEKIAVEILSPEKYSSPEDADYGNTIQITQNNKTNQVQLNDQGIGRYRMTKIYNEICPKLVAIPFKDDQLIFVVLKDQRPFTDKAMLLFYNFKTQISNFVETNVASKSIFIDENKIFIKTSKYDYQEKYGHVTIEGQKYLYIEKAFEPWLSFDGQNFKFDQEMTYQKFELKNFLKRSNLQRLINPQEATYRIALNHQTKKSCFSIERAEWSCISKL